MPNAHLTDANKLGFILKNNNGALFGMLHTSSPTICPRRSTAAACCGQSALRFARLGLEKRHNYIRTEAEVSTGSCLCYQQQAQLQRAGPYRFCRRQD
jgi:peptide subunit release factor 1 (eRF1)